MRKHINAHCHIYPAKIAERAVEGIKAFYGLDMLVLNGMTDDLIKEGESLGCVHYLVHSVATVPKQVNSINEFIAEEVNSHPGLFTGFGTLHPDSEDLEGDLNHLIELGLKGVKLHPDFQFFALNESKGDLVGDLIERAGLPTLVHCGDPRYNYSNPDQMKVFLERHPNLTVIGAHLGGWSRWEEAAEKLSGIPNFYVDCSSSLRDLSPEKAVELIHMYGVDKVLWGTDYPMWEAATEFEYFEKLPLSEEERELILYKNAAKLLNLTDL